VSATARELGLAACRHCGLLSRARALPPGHVMHCPRCDGVLHGREPASLQRTAALLLASYLLYVPAMMLPVSTVVSAGVQTTDTIWSGVKSLFRDGDPEAAILLFVASIVVPLAKLLVLSWLALSVRLGWRGRPRDRTVTYRVVEIIGRWSMLDVFVISLLVALLQLDSLAHVTPRPGVVCFAAVVVLTMFAAETFDPRLIWDQEADP